MNKIYASIITIGDELLIGQVIDTNSSWIAQELNKAGILVKNRVAVGDNREDIWQAIDDAISKVNIGFNYRGIRAYCR
jgi:nicotinamide-nucleotide amidase